MGVTTSSSDTARAVRRPRVRGTYGAAPVSHPLPGSHGLQPFALAHDRHFPPSVSRLNIWQRRLLWLLLLCSFLVFREPAPYDILFFPVAIILCFGGARLHPTLVPLILLMLMISIGGILATLPEHRHLAPIVFTLVTLYLALSAIVFAAVLLTDGVARFEAIRSGYVGAAVLASVIAIIGYLDISGFGGEFTKYSRASSTFKDPNVFSAFLVPALVFVVDDVLVRRRKILFRVAIGIIIVTALLLAFSRGAWLNAILSLLLFAFFAFLANRDSLARARILVSALLGLCAVALAVVVLLSIDGVREIFLQRASFSQSYDFGSTGRFGLQLRSIPIILDNWLGLGPYKFAEIFGNNPHNSYLNFFIVYGWLGGVAHIVLVVITWALGIWRALTPSPWQPMVICVVPPFIALSLQGFQIDMDHWRHYFLIMGLVWGASINSILYKYRY